MAGVGNKNNFVATGGREGGGEGEGEGEEADASRH